MASLSTTTTSIDCEGSCCCRCTPCSGVGYYDSYDVTVPGIVGYTYSFSGCESGIITIVPSVASPKTYTCVGFEASPAIFSGGTFTPPTYSASPKFGSAGGDGNCRWSYYNVTSSGGADVMEYIVFKGNSVIATYLINSFLCFPHSFFTAGATFRPAGDCRVPGSMPYPQDGTIIYSTNPAYASAVPSAGANWFQCGLNSDGTTYIPMGATPLDRVSGMIKQAVGPSVSVTKSQSLQVLRPIRCTSLGRRSEFLVGCNGWMCGHGCSKSLPAVPGGYCQTCESYEPDSDYESQGISGWIK